MNNIIDNSTDSPMQRAESVSALTSKINQETLTKLSLLDLLTLYEAEEKNYKTGYTSRDDVDSGVVYDALNDGLRAHIDFLTKVSDEISKRPSGCEFDAALRFKHMIKVSDPEKIPSIAADYLAEVMEIMRTVKLIKEAA